MVKKWKVSFQFSIFRDFLRQWMASQALWIMGWLWILGRQRDSGKLFVRWVYQYFLFSVCLTSPNGCPEELACMPSCFRPDFSSNQVSKTTLDGEKWIGWGKKKSTSPRITSSLVMIYPVPLLILQLSKSALYAWMTHGLYLNQINVSATSDRSSAQPLVWQMDRARVFFLLSFSSSLQTL